MSQCMIEIGDYERVESLGRTTPKARKEHACTECGRTIAVGEIYTHEAGVCEGEISTYKICCDCESLQALICGRLYGGLRETIDQAISDGDIEPTAPALRDLTPDALAWVCDLIEESWDDGDDEEGSR